MKITLDIPNDISKTLCKNAKTTIKSDAILMAIDEYNQTRKLKKLAMHLGTFKNLISKEELFRLRAGQGIGVKLR